MTWQEAIEHPANELGRERFRWLCSDANPDPETREGYRGLMIRQATGDLQEYPSLPRMIGNAARAMVDFVGSGLKLATEEEQARRLAICREPCEYLDAIQGRCRHGNCGCFVSAKTKLASSVCPIGKW